jgi:hypothetical protein
MAGRHLTSFSAFAAVILVSVTLMSGAAAARPTAAAPQFEPAKSGTAVVLDPTTGAVRAMASGPGYKVVSVTSLPDQHVLVRGKLNVVVVRPNLAFRVKVRNADGSQQSNVSLRLSRAPNFGSVVTKIAVKRDTQTVTFAIRTRTVAFAVKERIVITVASTSGKTLSSAAYPVIFALG